MATEQDTVSKNKQANQQRFSDGQPVVHTIVKKGGSHFPVPTEYILETDIKHTGKLCLQIMMGAIKKKTQDVIKTPEEEYNVVRGHYLVLFCLFGTRVQTHRLSFEAGAYATEL